MSVNLFVASVLALANGAMAGDIAPQPLPPAAMVEGRSFVSLTADWWRWARGAAIPPYLDPDGRLCEAGQSGPVWFLAGTDGTFAPKRECAVPEGKHVLVPVINMYYQAGTVQGTPCADLQSSAAVNNDRLVSAVVMVDGVVIEHVERFRVRSGCFSLALKGDADHAHLAAADGYWLLLPPMPAGKHTISVGANYGSKGAAFGNMRQNFEYVLHVGATSRVLDL